jgi:hypothetical protein
VLSIGVKCVHTKFWHYVVQELWCVEDIDAWSVCTEYWNYGV